MRKVIAMAVLAASVAASGHAFAFDTQSSGSGGAGSHNYIDPDDKAMSALRGDANVQQGDDRTMHFGDKAGGFKLQATPGPGIAGPGRYWSMEANPWR